MYAALKHSHMLFIVISVLLFEYRYVLKLLKKPVGKILLIVPHLNDTLLLISGISLAYIAHINPLVHSWLAAKIIALFFYIGFGMLALKNTGVKSLIGFVLANLTLVFMLLTAIKKNPLFFI